MGSYEVIARTIAIALLSFFATDLATPFLAPDAQPDLPACCRRDGKHHCAMMDMLESSDGTPKLASSRCPLFPRHSVTANIDSSAPPPPVLSSAGFVFINPTAKAQPEALYRISHARSRQKRGPPFLS